MSNTTTPDTAFEAAVSSRQRLEDALAAAGLNPAADFPLLNADVNVFGEGRVTIGSISLGAADRLCRAIGAPATI